MVRRLLITLLALAAASCGPADVPASATPVPTAAVSLAPDLAAPFAYDAGAALDVVERGSTADGTLVVRDIDFASPKGGRARAYLITPQGGAARPALVFVAGSNQRREDIRAEATAVARRGAVALVLEQSQIAAGRSQLWTFTAQDRAEAIQTVVDARRALDLLAARADVDRTRLGYYGFSYGAWLGAIAAAVDSRVRVLVLRSGGPQILTEIARSSGRTLAPDYVELMRGVDQMRFAPGIAASVLVQNGTRDTTYTSEQVRAWHERIGGAKTVKSYDAGHTLDATANSDAVAWIAERWRLP